MQAKRFNFKSCIILTLLVFGGASLPLILFEFGHRIEYLIAKGIPLLQNPKDKWDPILGWQGREHVLGQEGEVQTLVIGDSFTDGLDVPKEKMWFSYLPRSTNTKLIAYGGIGYGTYQEIEVLKKYIKEGQPKRIILQICSNDIINNYHDLEKDTLMQRPPAPRPFLENGNVVFRLPFDNYFYNLASSYSRVALRYIKKSESRMAKDAMERKLNSVEFTIAEKGWEYKPFREAVIVTNDLVTTFTKLAKPAEIIFLLIDDIEPYTTAIRKLSAKLKVPLIIPRRIQQFPANAMHQDGAHFNEYGNQLVGELTAKFIVDLENRTKELN